MFGNYDSHKNYTRPGPNGREPRGLVEERGNALVAMGIGYRLGQQ
jgi:hypothetical protein